VFIGFTLSILEPLRVGVMVAGANEPGIVGAPTCAFGRAEHRLADVPFKKNLPCAAEKKQLKRWSSSPSLEQTKSGAD
jgi:hypothetical protein